MWNQIFVGLAVKIGWLILLLFAGVLSAGALVMIPGPD